MYCGLYNSDNVIRHHSGQNVVDSRSAAEWARGGVVCTLMENGIGSSDCDIIANCGKRKHMYILSLVSSVRLKLISIFLLDVLLVSFFKIIFFAAVRTVRHKQ